MQHRRSQSFIGSGVLVLAASMLLNAAGFFFHALASRRLGVQQYGEFYALIATYTIAALPAQIFSPVVSKFAAEFTAHQHDAFARGLFVKVMQIFISIALAYVIGATLFGSYFSGFLHTAPSLIALTGLMAGVALLSAVIRAFGQGTQRFALYAGSLAAEGVGKIGLLVAGIVFAASLTSVIGAFLGGILLGCLVMALPLLGFLGKGPVEAVRLDWRRIAITTAAASAISCAVTGIGFADVIVVKHFFTAEQAGLYSAASLGGKMLLYFLGFIPTLLLSHTAHGHAKGESTRHALLTALGFTIAAGVLGILIYLFFGGLLLHALVGSKFDAALPLMIGYVIAMTFLAIASALASYGLATHRIHFAGPLALVTAGTIISMIILHSSLISIVDEMIVGTALMVIVTSVSLISQRHRKHRIVLDTLITAPNSPIIDTRG